jgi:hypothetical protein
MGKESQENSKTAHVVIYGDKKERLAEVVRTRAFKEKRKVTELEVADKIFEMGLSKEEKILGIV